MWRSIVDPNANNTYREFGSIIPEDKVMQELYSVFLRIHSGNYQPLQTQFYCHGIPNGECHIQGIGQTNSLYTLT